jgi:hypothetical protein
MNMQSDFHNFQLIFTWCLAIFTCVSVARLEIKVAKLQAEFCEINEALRGVIKDIRDAASRTAVAARKLADALTLSKESIQENENDTGTEEKPTGSSD